jgi:VCBS repeat-containing protein
MKYKGSLKALCGILLLGIAFFWLSQKEFAAGYPHESLENSLAYVGMIDVAVFDMDFRGTSALDNRVIAGTFGRGVYVSQFTANTNPPISTTDSITVLEGGTVTTISGGATSVLSNDSDPEGDSITTDLVTDTINGILVLSATGSFTYSHDDSETTTDSFSYRAYDGALYGNTVSVTITVTPVEECPLIQTPLSDITVSEDAADTVINFSGTFLDPEGDALTYSVTYTNTPLLTATINTTSLTLDFADNMVGTATVTLTANDLNCGVVTSESFLVTVTDINDLPVGIADTILVNEGETVAVTSANATSVLFNDTDIEGDNLSAGFLLGQPVPTLTPNLGTLSFLDNGTFSYTHGGTQIPGSGIATDTFFYRPYDGMGVLGNTTTVTIQITHTNDCPIVASAITTQTVMEDAADLDIDLGPVFTDEELNTITLTVSNTNTALLTAALNTTTLTLDFVANMTGSSTIILYASDGMCSTLVSSTFIVKVEPQNDAPVGTPDIINVNENEIVSSTTISITVLANDTDTEGDDLTATLVPGSGPFNHSGGAFSLQSSGTFVYNHDGSETTTDTFNYTLSDGLSTTVVSVTINITPINDCPIIDTFLPDITVNEDAADTVINLSPNFSDAEGNALSISFTNADPSIANVTLNTSTLTIQYIPEQNGTTTLTILVDDLNGCSTVQDMFLVNITAVNDPPVTVTENLFVLEGGTVTTTVLAATSLLANDTDTENDPLEAILITPASNGTVALSSTGTFTYTHDRSETTTDTFEYRAAEIAGQDGNIVLVNITIQEVNDCPVYTAVGGFPAADEDDPAWTWNYGAEISDADGNTPLYTLTHTATNLLSAVTDANGVITFTPEPDQWGTTSMTLNVSDRRGCAIDIVIPVVINSRNDCPTLENPIADITAFEDDPDLFIPLANIFADIDTSSLNYSTSIGNNSIVATSFTATALIIDFLPNQSGSTFINLITSDGDLNCTVDDLFTVSVSPVNDPPTGIADVVNLVRGATTSVLNDGVTTSVLANDSDPEGDAITAVLVSGPINGTVSLSANGNFTYTHDNSATVTDSYTYTPRDTFTNIGNTTTVTIYINNAPVGVTETIALFEGGTATTTTAASTSVLSNDTDADAGDAALLTATIGTSPLYGTLALNADGSFTYTHSGSEDLTDSFTYIPFDGKGYGLPTVVSVTISPTNDAPVAFPDSITVGIGQTTSLLTGGMNSVLANDTDADGDSLTAILVSGTSSGTLVLNPGGTFSYTQNGVMDAGDSFTYMARDSSNVDSNVVTVNISLTCSPCTEKTIEAGSSGVIVSYRGCDCRKYDVYVPKGKVFIFCHLDGSVSIDQGSYTVLSSKVCY